MQLTVVRRSVIFKVSHFMWSVLQGSTFPLPSEWSTRPCPIPGQAPLLTKRPMPTQSPVSLTGGSPRLSTMTQIQKLPRSDKRYSPPSHFFRYFGQSQRHPRVCPPHPPRSFATKFELFINFIGLICAVGGGAAQVYLPLAPATFTILTGPY